MCLSEIWLVYLVRMFRLSVSIVVIMMNVVVVSWSVLRLKGSTIVVIVMISSVVSCFICVLWDGC